VDFNLAAFLETEQRKVEALLRRSLESRRLNVPPRLFEAMTYSLGAGGKRLRPILCLSFATACGGSEGCADAAACALEMVHTYSLIHDDLPSMDDDDLRRGQPTSHKVFGEALATLAGDALLTDAFAELGNSPHAAALTVELAQAAGSSGMVGGQVLDIAEDRPAKLAYLSRMHGLKTGRLLRAACRMGVISAAGSPALLEAAGRFGEHVGLAFQIIDDVLDVTGSSAALGKTHGADAAAGKVTYPSLLGVQRARDMAEEEIRMAIEALSDFKNAAALRALAQYTVERRH